MPNTDSAKRNRFTSGLVLRVIGLLVYVFLLTSAFPPFMHAESAFFAVVPLILLARYTRGLKKSFCWGWAAGTMFWLFNLAWLLRLSVTGGSWTAAGAAWLFLAIYCGIYTGLFTMLASHLFDIWMAPDCDNKNASAMGGIKAQLSIVISLPLLWAGLEYLRGTIFTGFPWNALGVSQFRNEGLLQLASWGGVYCVSAVVLLANTGLAFTILRFVDMFRRRKGPRFNLPLILGLGGAMFLWLAGVYSGRAWRDDNSVWQVRVVALQPAVPQQEKWDEEQVMEIVERLRAGTSLAAALKPDMIVWPETACPDLVSTQSGLATGFAAVMTGEGVPILAGAIEYELNDGRTNFYNSSILYGKDGAVEGVYRKMHLVPFGEYIPGEALFPALSRMSPLGFSCTPGKKMTVFEYGTNMAPFSALICFEDVFPALSRLAVRNGARFLVNQTNDSWFDGSSGSVQHLANAVFRCVENRISMVRCANTGVTCFINPLGQLDKTTKALLDKAGRVTTPEEGNRMGAVLISSSPNAPFYSRHGDLGFALPCAAGTLFVFALAVAGAYRKNKQNCVKERL